ncbi:MAG: thioredoxin family protein [Euryarchaeota archaeon]|nr:thioredoxin family protein [Euryarchaeota archaeon]
MSKMRLAILSFACCNPTLAVHDQRYVDRIREAAEAAGVDYELEIIHATEARMTNQHNYMGEIMPLFNKYGQTVSPALFINRSLQLWGGVPPLEKLTTVLQKAKKAIEQGRL